MTKSEELPDPLASSSWRTRGLPRLVYLLVSLVLLPTAAFLVGRATSSPGELAELEEPPQIGLLTASVERRDLEFGTAYQAVVVRTTIAPTLVADAQLVVTASAPETGSTVVDGNLLVEIEDRPVFVFEGDLPMISDIAEGDTGSHVAQLQDALIRLGYLGGEATARFDRATAQAVLALYRDAGYNAATTTTEELLEVVAVPAAEFIYIPSLPAEVAGAPLQRGDLVSPGDPLITVFSSEATIEVVAGAGGLPDGFGDGRLAVLDLAGALVGSANLERVESRVSEDGSAVIVAVVVPDSPFALAAGTRVTLVDGYEERERVLGVPISALRSDASGNIYVLVAEGGTTRSVRVTVGAESGGFVEIVEDGRLAEGDEVVTGASR